MDEVVNLDTYNAVISYRGVLIKWLGGNGYNARLLESIYPRKFNRYYDPFIGGGATLRYFTHESTISDTNKLLIDIWKTCKYQPDLIIDNYNTHFGNFTAEDYYYEVRERFNANKNHLDFLWLTRTCVNGLIRFNSKGEFNSPVHKGRRGIQPLRFAKTVYFWHNHLQNKRILNEDYRTVLEKAKKGDFVLLDPPYLRTPKGMYGESFDWNSFYMELNRLNKKDVKWCLTFDGVLDKSIYVNVISGIKGNSPFAKLKGSSKPTQDYIYTNY